MRTARHQTVNHGPITEELARTVMGWRSAQGRFLKAGRGWLPKWRFAPFDNIEDAFQLLDRAADWFRLTRDGVSAFVAEVHVGGHTGKASGDQQARVITTAVARALMSARKIDVT